MNLPELVKAAGVVGAGGAGFPTHVKLDAKADCFLINAAECEPLIETDKYLTRTYADRLIAAVDRVGEHLGAGRRVIALKAKYTAEIAALKRAVTDAGSKVELLEMPTFYPAGDEQIIVNLALGRTVPERGLPLQVGAVVCNVGTMLGVADALEGTPVTEKFLSVTGEVTKPLMLKVPIGTPILECIERAGPTITGYAVILGGPMMGKVVSDPAELAALSVTKTLGNLLVLPQDHFLITRVRQSIGRISAQTRSACVQCRFCTELCPRYQTGHQIRPNLVMRNLYREGQIADDAEYLRAFGDAANCCDCGVCEMFACPMGLSPRRVNGYIKMRLAARGLQAPRNGAPVTRAGAENSRVPTKRLVARLGLSQYDGLHATECVTLEPDAVWIPFQQHIGKPAQPVRQAGERVKKGELLAAAPEGALSVNIHASIDGIITRIDATGAAISRGKEV